MSSATRKRGAAAMHKQWLSAPLRPKVSGQQEEVGRRYMLILTRRVGESLKIGDEVTVTVLALKGNQVRIGIAAPKSVAVHREEIFERIKAEEASPPVE